MLKSATGKGFTTTVFSFRLEIQPKPEVAVSLIPYVPAVENILFGF